MVKSVKCKNDKCKAFGIVQQVSVLFINKVAPLSGPFNCPMCKEKMQVVEVIPGNYKGNPLSKSMPRRIATSPSRPSSKPARRKKVAKKLVKRVLGMGTAKSSFKKQAKKTASQKLGPRKRS